jgi:ferrous iron transport protein B
MKPLGLGDWRILVSLVSGFIAKESVVSTMEILYGEGVENVMSPLAAASMLVFSLLYTPCVAAIAAVRRELGGKWAFALAAVQCVIAWVAAFGIRLIGLMIGAG